MAGGVSPWGLAAGAPPLPVESGPVEPCGCFTPFVSGDIVVPVLWESAVCARTKLALEAKQIVTIAMGMVAARLIRAKRASAAFGSKLSRPWKTENPSLLCR